MIVAELNVRLAIQQDLDVLAGEFDAQNMPSVRCDRRIDILDRDSSTIGSVIERHVVLKRVGARHVVVYNVLPEPNDSTSLIFLSQIGADYHLDITVVSP